MRMMLEKKVQSVRHALTGLKTAWFEEHNFRIEIVCGVAAVILGWFLQISREEFLILFLLIGFVLATEALNTALEEFCDMVRSSPDPHIAKIKDLGAAAVLLASFTSLFVGALIFIPHLA